MPKKYNYSKLSHSPQTVRSLMEGTHKELPGISQSVSRGGHSQQTPSLSHISLFLSHILERYSQIHQTGRKQRD